MRVILLGPPGAGKGTQAVELARKLGVTQVSSGDLFRQHERQDTELGRLARSYMERGDLVPDGVTIKMVMGWIRAPEQAKGFVLDGFPRTLAQAEALDRALEDIGGIDNVLYIKVSQDEMTRRLSGRLICRNCQKSYHQSSSQPSEPGKCDSCGGELYQRPDDRPRAVQKRMEVYEEETEPLVQYYRRAGKLEDIDGEGSIEGVRQAAVAAVGG